MNDAQRAELRRLYGIACHGAGAQVRIDARSEIADLLAAEALGLGEALTAEGLSLSAYFASRPYTRGAP